MNMKSTMKAKDLIKILQKYPEMEVVIAEPGFGFSYITDTEVKDVCLDDDKECSDKKIIEAGDLTHEEWLKKFFPKSKVIILYSA